MDFLFSNFLYISIFLVSSSFAYIAQFGNTFLLRAHARIICFLSLFIPAGLRYGIGQDYGSYVNIYLEPSSERLQYLVEPGFRLIIEACRFLHFSPHLFIVTISAITYWIICFGMGRKYFFYIIIFYNAMTCYLYSYNIIRQYLAISLLLYGLSLFYNNKKSKGILSIIISIFIHISSVFGLLIILFSNVRVNAYFRIVLTVLIMVIVPLFLADIITIFIVIYPRLDYMLDVMQKKQEYNSGLSIILYSGISLLVLANTGILKDVKNGNFIINCNWFYLLLMPFVYISQAFYRMQTAMIFIPLFSIGILMTHCKKYKKIIFFSLVSPWLLYCLVWLQNSSMFPYNSIFHG